MNRRGFIAAIAGTWGAKQQFDRTPRFRDSGLIEETIRRREATLRLENLIGRTPLGAEIFGNPFNAGELRRLQYDPKASSNRPPIRHA